VEKLHEAPVILVNLGRHVHKFLVDRESKRSLIKPDVCLTKFTQAEFIHYGVTGKTLQVYGNQIVKFGLRGNTYSLQFCVCKLTSDVDAILETDFLKLVRDN
jgi:hypothetical protein